ncbi:PTS fructose transporter subunit IIB, partial [Citrobacter freundii]
MSDNGCYFPRTIISLVNYYEEIIMSKKLIAVCACPMGLAHTF